jgi:imidazolonepropionase-like amidohydrolase
MALLVAGGVLIDGTGAAPVRDGAVLAKDGRIVAAGAAAEVRTHPDAAEAEQLDARGKWVIPGLIDAHVHLVLTGLESLPVFLACGVTAVRDVGGHLDGITAIAEAERSGATPGPRVVYSGPLIDGEVPSWPPADLPIIVSSSGPEDAARIADECIARGAESVKLYFRLPLGSVRAAIARVDGRVPVTGHLGRTLASEAVAAGINAFEHIVVTLYNDVVEESARFDAMQSEMSQPGFWGQLLAGWAGADLDGAGTQRLLEAMREHDVALDPTLDLMEGGGTIDRPEAMRYAPRGREWPARPADPPPLPDFVLRGRERMRDCVRRYHEMGGRVTAGTDVGAAPYAVAGFSLHGEMRLLAASGMAKDAVLRAATLDAARSMRIDADAGSIEPGKSADMVVLDADPLADIAAVERVHRVVRAGVVHEPAPLLATYDAAATA